MTPSPRRPDPSPLWEGARLALCIVALVAIGWALVVLAFVV